MTGTTETMKSRMRIRLSTMLLLVVMLTLMVRLYVLKRSESKMQAMLAGFRDTVAEGVVDILDRPLALPYADGAPLEQFLRTVKARLHRSTQAAGRHPDLRRPDRSVRG